MNKILQLYNSVQDDDKETLPTGKVLKGRNYPCLTNQRSKKKKKANKRFSPNMELNGQFFSSRLLHEFVSYCVFVTTPSQVSNLILTNDIGARWFCSQMGESQQRSYLLWSLVGHGTSRWHQQNRSRFWCDIQRHRSRSWMQYSKVAHTWGMRRVDLGVRQGSTCSAVVGKIRRDLEERTVAVGVFSISCYACKHNKSHVAADSVSRWQNITTEKEMLWNGREK